MDIQQPKAAPKPEPRAAREDQHKVAGYLLRLPPELRDALDLIADAEDVSLHALVIALLAEGVTARMPKTAPTTTAREGPEDPAHA